MPLRGFDIGVAVTVALAVIGGVSYVSSLKGQIDGLDPDRIRERQDQAIDQIQSMASSSLDKIREELGSVQLPVGTIIAWTPVKHGEGGEVIEREASIPAGWAVCESLDGTPDLRNRFLVGAESTAKAGNFGGRADIPADGQHSHRATAAPSSVRDNFGNDNADDRWYTTVDGSHNHGGSNLPPFYSVVFLCKTQ